MIAEIEAGNVATVIVKDMSRLGRDYLKVGYYTEIFFVERDVRYIAIMRLKVRSVKSYTGNAVRSIKNTGFVKPLCKAYFVKTTF